MHFGYYTATILGFSSVSVAFIISIWRLKLVQDVYLPFVYLIWIAFINELLNTFLYPVFGYYNFINNNLYTLFESTLLLWLFKNLNVFRGRIRLYHFMFGFFVAGWTFEILYRNCFNSSYTFYFNILYYLVVVISAIRVLNELLFTEKVLLRNPTFLICIAVITFFTYAIIHKMFYLFGLSLSMSFLMSIQSILVLINFITNLVFGLAIIFMQKRRAFTFQF